MTRGLAALVVLATLALAACDTEPAQNVSYTSADARARVGCVDTRDSTPAYNAYWRIAYRKVSDSAWATRPWHQYNCADDTAPHYLAGSPFTEPLTGLAPGTEYEYRLDISVDGSTVYSWYDRDGAENGTTYERFTTTQVPAVTPKSAQAFRDSQGVNSRIRFNHTPFANVTRVGEAMDYTGIRHLREGWHVDSTTDFTELVQNHRATFTFGPGEMDPDNNNTCGPFQIAQHKAEWQNRPIIWNALKYVEGLNEIDNPGPAGERIPGWDTCAKQYMQERWNQFGGLKPILAPTFICTHRFTSNPEKCPGSSFELVGNVEQWVDYGNMHPYPGGETPDSVGECDGWRPCNPFEYNALHARVLTPTKPLLATETGYHTWVCGVAPEPACPGDQGQAPVSEAVQAPYVLRTFLEAFRRGIVHTDYYAIVDANDCNALWKWGLYRCDWTPKPAAHALHNMNVATIGEGAPALTALRLLIEQAPSDLRHVVLRRGDGDYVIAIWRYASLWNRDTRQPIPVTPANVRLLIPDATAVRAIRPVDSAAEQTLSITDRRVNISVAGAPVLLRVTR